MNCVRRSSGRLFYENKDTHHPVHGHHLPTSKQTIADRTMGREETALPPNKQLYGAVWALAVISTPSARMTARVVFRVGLPRSLNER